MKKSMLAGIDLPNLTEKPTAPEGSGGLFIPLSDIQPDPDQPRHMGTDSDTDLDLLAESILQHGILQPIAVKALGGGKYQVIAGERRWRAAKIAVGLGKACKRKGYDLSRIPVFIQDPESDADKLEMQMVENLARQDMSPSDIGSALQRLLNDTGITKAELARRLGRSDTWVKATLASASPEALLVCSRLGVLQDKIGAGEMLRLVSWSNDPEKTVVLDWIAESIKSGQTYSRPLIDDAETRYEIVRRFPKMAARNDLTLADLKTWQTMWFSPDAAQKAVAGRVLDGLSLAEAMQAPLQGATPAVAASRAVAAEGASGTSAADSRAVVAEDEFEAPDNASTVADAVIPPPFSDDFDIDAVEAEDADAARGTLEGKPASGFTHDQRRSVDVAGTEAMEGRGPNQMADVADLAITIKLPSRVITRLLEKAGIANDLTVDQDVLLRALDVVLR
ncbi:ParB/RepB/Spo0J family partition protein [Acidithiobacillus ferriphilus]|uniref:ParB/RepB/Spo0J family partition protein n=1 Tax=Acidithiobacillus ferriphilus TaxID=1689834 RepID=UPI001C077D84|nr:ParB/RepB/Spo0J family partition protein [Acidithiobacillus ferriphilus]MBU2832993.1 ParB/RepB/Spo0J family partition protein [Acidithiobacillus ferriphilus]